MTFGEVVFAAYVAAQLSRRTWSRAWRRRRSTIPTNFTFPAGAHVCEVEVDPETGVVQIDRFVAVDDFGKVINPMIVEGQVHGGIAQGIGQALSENGVYDESRPADLRLAHGLLHAERRRPAELPGRA